MKCKVCALQLLLLSGMAEKCDNNGISALNLINASNKLGFYSRGIKCDIDDLSNIYLPAKYITSDIIGVLYS